MKRTLFSAGTSVARSRTFGRWMSSAPIPVWILRFRCVTVSDNALTTVRQGLFGMLRDKGVSLGSQRSRQHPAGAIAGDLGQRIIHRFRLTKGDDVCSLLHGVSFLLEVLAGFSTRHDTPPSQIPSPSFPA